MTNNITIYINWEDRRVLTKAEADSLLERQIDEAIGDNDEFLNFLDERYSSSEIWAAFNAPDAEERQAQIHEKWAEDCRINCEDDFDAEWEMFDFPVGG